MRAALPTLEALRERGARLVPWCVDRIREHGIHPGRGHGGVVYRCEDPNIAAWWGVRTSTTTPAAVLAVDVRDRPVETHWSGIGSPCHHGTVPARLVRVLDAGEYSVDSAAELIAAEFGGEVVDDLSLLIASDGD